MLESKYGRASHDAHTSESMYRAPDFVERWSLQLHGELVGRFEGGGFGFGGEVEDEALEDEEFVGGGAAEFEVGAGYEADGAAEFAAGFVAAGLLDEVFGGEGWHAEALP